jgi:hypothetical protein
VAVFPAPLLVEFKGASADRFADVGWEIGWFFVDSTRWFSANIIDHSATPYLLQLNSVASSAAMAHEYDGAPMPGPQPLQRQDEESERSSVRGEQQ